MGLSETILAASIGAAATVAAAMFQLVSALRVSKSRQDTNTRPKKGSTFRSLLAVFALMVVSAVGGYLFSEFRSERTANDMRSMRDELNAKLQVLSATTERLAGIRNNGENAANQATNPAAPASVEAFVYAPACQGGSNSSGACTEANSQRLALCGAIPGDTQARKFDLFFKDANSDVVAKAEFDQDLGGAKFLGPPAEYPQGEHRKAVCVNFLHWSDKPHIATIVLEYGTNVDAPTSSSTSAVAATQAPTSSHASMTSAAP